jgi:hypothetical protein
VVFRRKDFDSVRRERKCQETLDQLDLAIYRDTIATLSRGARAVNRPNLPDAAPSSTLRTKPTTKRNRPSTPAGPEIILGVTRSRFEKKQILHTTQRIYHTKGHWFTIGEN